MTVEKKAEPKKLLDSLLDDYRKSEDLSGENGLLKQLTKLLASHSKRGCAPNYPYHRSRWVRSSKCWASPPMMFAASRCKSGCDSPSVISLCLHLS